MQLITATGAWIFVFASAFPTALVQGGYLHTLTFRNAGKERYICVHGIITTLPGYTQL